MNNVVAFRHSAISRALAPAWPSLRRSSGALMHTAIPRRRALVAEWRISATDGRLECRWRSEGGEQRDEDGSQCSWRRRAA
ncbi:MULTISPECIES: hypothetical protein [unclassified Bosea (in: a-proteobacteria)]|uniref:hypothetical protein n=1 Tax=unclassified Bosea (in: a-proteobacteria) TaxID=2653178 RepID=UPI00125F5E42|nr:MULTISPECIES: hypothetical protein [unclassified Bosea (in: a-proteobacteria)]